MRQIEIANPTDYTMSDAHMAKFLEQTGKSHPPSSEMMAYYSHPAPPRPKRLTERSTKILGRTLNA
jgi:hypothetical protein